MKKNNREKILKVSVEMFNSSGVVAVTTNHIAKQLGLSPGNLYFHFQNREEIIRELFQEMCAKTYAVWMPNKKLGRALTPIELVEQTFDVFYEYRFFHREMYHLRRKDPKLAEAWRKHIRKSVKLLNAFYLVWEKNGIVIKVTDPRDRQLISDSVLMTSSTFMQFFESPARPATRTLVNKGVEHVLRFLALYHTPEHRESVRRYMSKIQSSNS